MTKLTELLGLKRMPVAIYHTKEKPGHAEESKDHCVIFGMLYPAAEEGRTFAISKSGRICPGAVSGLGFGPEEDREFMINRNACGTDEVEGRHYFKTEAISRKTMNEVKVFDNDGYIVFEPLDSAVSHDAPIETVVFLTDALGLSGLTSLIAYSREKAGSGCRWAYGFACEQIYAIPRAESEGDDPQAIIGLTELGIRKRCNDGDLTFTVPYCLYRRMEDDAEESFLSGKIWGSLTQ